MREYPRRLHHKTPGWVQEGSLFHVRIRVLPTQSPPLTDPELASQLLDAAQRYHDLGRWWCELLLLMPDHLHAIAAFPSAPGMSEVVRNWKRGTARFQRVQWQEGYFDHRLRDEKAARETWDYMRRNPVVKNLCAAEADWPWWWSGIANNPLHAPK
jgi:REP element-mobilizing transposase RayT